jgi:hypothetical protein
MGANILELHDQCWCRGHAWHLCVKYACENICAKRRRKQERLADSLLDSIRTTVAERRGETCTHLYRLFASHASLFSVTRAARERAITSQIRNAAFALEKADAGTSKRTRVLRLMNVLVYALPGRS